MTACSLAMMNPRSIQAVGGTGEPIDQAQRRGDQAGAEKAPSKRSSGMAAVPSDDDRLRRRLPVVLCAARACALEERDGAFIRVERHLLRLARMSANEDHASVTMTDMRDLHGHRRAVHRNDRVLPIELTGPSRRKSERRKAALAILHASSRA
jgi:hypothetical protein